MNNPTKLVHILCINMSKLHLQFVDIEERKTALQFLFHNPEKIVYGSKILSLVQILLSKR